MAADKEQVGGGIARRSLRGTFDAPFFLLAKLFEQNDDMKKIMFVFGTRPEAIKLCPLVKEFEQHADKFKTFICVTGQHRAMLDQVLKIFNVVPNYDLDLMKNDQHYLTLHL